MSQPTPGSARAPIVSKLILNSLFKFIENLVLIYEIAFFFDVA